MLTPSVAKYFYDFSKETVAQCFALDSAEGVMHSIEALDRMGIGMEPNMHLQMSWTQCLTQALRQPATRSPCSSSSTG